MIESLLECVNGRARHLGLGQFLVPECNGMTADRFLNNRLNFLAVRHTTCVCQKPCVIENLSASPDQPSVFAKLTPQMVSLAYAEQQRAISGIENAIGGTTARGKSRISLGWDGPAPRGSACCSASGPGWVSNRLTSTVVPRPVLLRAIRAARLPVSAFMPVAWSMGEIGLRICPPPSSHVNDPSSR